MIISCLFPTVEKIQLLHLPPEIWIFQDTNYLHNSNLYNETFSLLFFSTIWYNWIVNNNITSHYSFDIQQTKFLAVRLIIILSKDPQFKRTILSPAASNRTAVTQFFSTILLKYKRESKVGSSLHNPPNKLSNRYSHLPSFQSTVKSDIDISMVDKFDF